LDEPTTGVDAVSRKEFWEMLKRLKQQGITILVSTPYMDEATLCERIALIQFGKILSVDSPANIIHAYPEKLYAIRSENIYKLLTDLRRYNEILNCYAFGEFVHLSFRSDDENNRQKLLDYVHGKEHKKVELKQITPTIEDCFIRLLKQ
jgi:ABC-type multidrug transport system ATPase subunit